MRFETPECSYSIDLLCDGGAYVFPGLAFSQTNQFLRSACADGLLIKLPSARGLADYHRRSILRLSKSDPDGGRFCWRFPLRNAMLCRSETHVIPGQVQQ
jgi:hypothetical protein